MKLSITNCNQQSAASDRVEYLDVVRGVFVILIIVGHHLMGLPETKKYICSFMLPPFMLLSGFLYAYKQVWERPFGQTVVKNFQRLIYPYVTLSVINLSWNILYYKVIFPEAVPEYSLKRMLLYTVTTYGYNALWYLPAVFWGTLLFVGIRRTKYHHHICLFLSACLIVFYILFDARLTGKGAVSYIYCYLFRITVAVVFIFAGSVLFQVFRKMSRKQEWFLLISCIVISGIIAWLYQRYPESFPIVNPATHRLGNPYFYYLTVLSNFIAITLLCKMMPRSMGIFTYFGRHSLIVLGLHMDIFVRIAWYIVPKLQLNFGEIGNSLMVIALEAAMAPAFVFVIDRYFPFVLKFPQKTDISPKNF